MKKINLLPFIKATSNLGLVALRVTQDGERVASCNWDDDARRNVYSASKSFTSAAVGIAVREGLLSLDERLVDAFAEDLPDEVSENLTKARVRDLLTMTLGQDKAYLMGGERPFIEEEDWVRYALSRPFTDEPGTKFLYNNVGPYLAGVLVQRRAGCDLVSYLMPRLFKPLGIRRPMWEQDPMGYTFGAGGLFLNLPELHKLGLLYLQKGRWEGRQILPEEWVEESLSVHIELNENMAHGYGYLFWAGPFGSFRADGKYCQLSIIIPEKNAVISCLAECRNSDALHAAIWNYIYPEL